MRYNIYLRSDGRYEGRVNRGKSPEGKWIFRYFFGHSRKEVEQRINEYRAAEDSYCLIEFGVLFSEWLDNIKLRIKESTYANYLMKAEKHILPEFSPIKANEISESDIYGFIEKKKESGLSDRYISDIVVLIKSVFKYASRKYNCTNPLDNISLLKSKKSEVKILDKSEQKQLEQYIAENQTTTTLGIALALSTGIRIGELCALKWEDINLKKRIITVSKTIQRIKSGTHTKVIITDPKSESSKRLIPIPDCIIPMLRKFQNTGDKYIISGTEIPTEPRTLQYRFAKILKNANLPSVRFHSLRHLFATNCIKLGFDIKSLSELLGHSNIKITLNRYVHSDFSQKAEYMKRLDMRFSQR